MTISSSVTISSGTKELQIDAPFAQLLNLQLIIIIIKNKEGKKERERKKEGKKEGKKEIKKVLALQETSHICMTLSWK